MQKAKPAPTEIGCLCKECPFAKDGQPSHVPVWGEGPEDPVGILVGESPGRDEAEMSRPFVGQTGRQLNRVLKDKGLDRSKLFVCNAVLCKPTDKTSKRMSKAVKCCKPAFELQIGKFRQTKHFLLMGKYATLAYYGKLINLEKGRGFVRNNV